MAQHCCAEAIGSPIFRPDADLLYPCLHAQVCKGWMRELVLHMPVLVGDDVSAFPVSFCFHDIPRPQLLPPTKQWLLQPVPHGLRIAELALCGQRRAACPSLAMPQDLILLPPSQLQNIQRLALWDAQCPDLPPMPRLTHLAMSFEPVAAHAALPLPSLNMLEVLEIHGADSCPSLSSLSRLTRLVLVSHPLPAGPTRPPVYRASADLSQVLKVCYILNVAAIHKRLCHVRLCLICCKGLPQLRALDLSWASPEPVIFGNTLMRLTQVVNMELKLPDFSRLEQLPPHITQLRLHAWELLDMAAVPCLQCCSSLQSLWLQVDKGVHCHAPAGRVQVIAHFLGDSAACRCHISAGSLAGAHPVVPAQQYIW